MPTQLAACLLTGHVAGPDGVCPEHGETACVITIEVPEPVSACVIPGYQCTQDHDVRPVSWPPTQRS